jgi:hypothetical protein
MKTYVKVIAGVVAVLALGAGAFLFFNDGLAGRADDFLSAAKRQDFAQARSMLSTDLSASTTEATLRDFLSRGELLDYRDAQWTREQVDGEHARLAGTVTTQQGTSTALTLEWIKERGGWRILSIQRALPGLLPDTLAPIPSTAIQTQMAKQAMDDFAKSVQQGSMEHFRATTSQAWQQQYTLAQFSDSFRSAIPLKPFFEGLEGLTPEITPVSTRGINGRIVIAGKYPRGQSSLYFDATYVYEAPNWKLLAFGFRLQ